MSNKDTRSEGFWFIVVVVLVAIIFNLAFHFKDAPVFTCWKGGPVFNELKCIAGGGVVRP